MNRNDLRHIDLNLLVVFEALIQERNLTRAAEKLSVGQPAVSASLLRLRALFNDPLFERLGRKMQPTPRAFEIARTLGPALDSVCTAVDAPQRFDPATSQAVFKIGLNDDIEFALLPSLVKQLRAKAPGVALIVRRTDVLEMQKLLLAGEIAAGVGYVRDLPPTLSSQVLRRCGTLLLRADAQAGRVSLDDFCERPHARVPFGGGALSLIDVALGKLNRQRRVALTVSQFSGLAALLEGTDLLVAVPDYTAPLFAERGGVRVEPLPLALAPFELTMTWRSDREADPGEAWLRTQLLECFGEPLSAKLRA